MRKHLMGVALCCLLCVPAVSGAAQGPSSSNPLSAWLHTNFVHGKNFIAKAAEVMPENLYGMRPGPQMEVRTFGQIVGHLAIFNYLYCSDAKGQKNPAEGKDFEKLATKAELVKALNDSFNYCDGVYSGMTDASLTETISATRDNGSKVPMLRASRLIGNISHNQEHYGNIVTYMRIKSMVPPSSMRP
jgi:uncharacterized damage-inducible protein DinB